jgi:hypothetical protein
MLWLLQLLLVWAFTLDMTNMAFAILSLLAIFGVSLRLCALAACLIYLALAFLYI